MLQQVLSVGRTVFHTADEPYEFDVQSVDTEVDAGPLSRLEYLVLELLADLRDDFLDTCGMYAAVDYELVEREPRDFAPYGVECGKQYRVGSVVDYDLDSGSRLESTDVPALAADDAALDLVVVYGEGGDGILDSRLGRRALDSVDDYPLGLLGGVETGLVHGIVDICLGL